MRQHEAAATICAASARLGLRRSLAGRASLDRERMQAVREFLRERGIDHPMTLQPGLSGEGFGHDTQAEMRFSAFPPSCMPVMALGLVLDLEAQGRKGLFDQALNSYRARLTRHHSLHAEPGTDVNIL